MQQQSDINSFTTVSKRCSLVCQCSSILRKSAFVIFLVGAVSTSAGVVVDGVDEDVLPGPADTELCGRTDRGTRGICVLALPRLHNKDFNSLLSKVFTVQLSRMSHCTLEAVLKPIRF